MPRPFSLEYRVSDDPVALSHAAAQHFVHCARAAVESRGKARLALSGGSTPKATFQLLADKTQPYRAMMPWEKLEIYWVDERCLPPDHPDSNYHMTRENLLDHVPIPPRQIHRMQGELDPEEAAAKYESELRNQFRLEGAQGPVFDMLALGMGDDGHTASLVPHTEAGSGDVSLRALTEKFTHNGLKAVVVLRGKSLILQMYKRALAEVIERKVNFGAAYISGKNHR